MPLEAPTPPDEGEATEVVGAARERLYRQHIYSANLFAERARALETGKPGEVSQEDQWRHRAYVTGAVFAASAFLETSINELYLDLQNLTPILHKYQVALSLADADSYDESKPPFLDADSLLKLRDALLSCKVTWDDKRGKPQTLEKRLRTKFPSNALAPAKAPWFPDRCLGAGCASWSVKTVQLFSDDFCHRMGIPTRARVAKERADKPSR